MPREIDDSVEWFIDNHNMKMYNSSLVWQSVRYQQDEKDWADVIWFKEDVPKHAFNM